MITLGNNVHIFARPHRREELAWCFETALRCGPARTVEYPGIYQPMSVVSFPGGGHLSIEFTDDAPDDEHPRFGAWLELRADETGAVLQGALDAGLTQVRHPGHCITSWPRGPGVHHCTCELNAPDPCTVVVGQP